MEITFDGLDRIFATTFIKPNFALNPAVGCCDGDGSGKIVEFNDCIPYK